MSGFPENFYWGAATASYQVEGCNENTDWAKAAKEGRVPPAGRLANHYELYEQDFDIARELGHNAHRISIEWARIEPREGEFDHKEVEHYRNVLKALRKRKIEPFVTLWHFTLPLWFSESGGFERKDAPEVFARYCAFVVKELGDLCTHFSTINEPNVYSMLGYVYGAWPPFKRFDPRPITSNLVKTQPHTSVWNFLTYFSVLRRLATAHNEAYRAIKQSNPEVEVGVVKHVHVYTANWNPFYKLAAVFLRYFQTYMFMNRVQHSCDAVGLNYYQWTGLGQTLPTETTDMGWKIRPEGIYHALKTLWRYRRPIYITEAGLADAADKYRADYIRRQVKATARALDEGVDVRGHLYWSLMDNYEWAEGTDKRFGLVEIDYKTLERRIRPSAWEYKKLIEEYSVK